MQKILHFLEENGRNIQDGDQNQNCLLKLQIIKKNQGCFSCLKT
jgi:hypothetical protein